MQIREVGSDAGFRGASPVVRELHHDLDERRYLELIPEMRAAGYGMFAVREGSQIVAVAGVQRLTNLYYCRHFYAHDLSVTSAARFAGTRRDAGLPRAQNPIVVTPRAAGRGCPISARNRTVGVAQSGL